MKRVEIAIDDGLGDAVFSEKDEFRLAVRGVTLMETVLKEAIGDAFADGMPAALEGLNWPSLVRPGQGTRTNRRGPAEGATRAREGPE